MFFDDEAQMHRAAKWVIRTFTACIVTVGEVKVNRKPNNNTSILLFLICFLSFQSVLC